jgi:hypothetical protein
MVSELAFKNSPDPQCLLGVWRSTCSEPILKKGTTKMFQFEKRLNSCIFKRPSLQPARERPNLEECQFFLSHCCFLVSPGFVSTIPVLVVMLTDPDTQH